MRHILFLICATVAWSSQTVSASVTEYTNKTSWQNAVSNNYTTITFTEFPLFTQVTTQYSYLGVTFTDPSGDLIIPNPSFLNDGVGLYGNSEGTVDLQFSQSMYWIGVDTGFIQLQLFNAGQLIYTSSQFLQQAGSFAGLVSNQAFDAARLLPVTGGSVYIDDLHFGPSIPGPGALALMAAAALFNRRKRRQ